MSNITDFYKDKYPAMRSDGNRILSFTDAAGEYEELKSGVLIHDLYYRDIVKLAGEEAFDFLHRISTNELNSLRDNEQKNTIFVNEKGRIIDRVTAFKFRDHALLLCNAGKGNMVEAWLERFIIMEDLVPKDISETYATLEVLGKQAESFLISLFGKAVELIDNKRFLHLSFEKINVVIAKIFYSENDYRFTVLLPAEDHDRFVEILLSNNTIFNVGMCGEEAYELFRINKITPAENELWDKFNPHEASLTSEISLTKGCFIGQEVIARLDTYDKVQKKLVKVKTDSKYDKLPVQLVDKDGNDAGWYTSQAAHEINGKYYGLAYIRKQYLEKDSTIYIDDEEDIILEIC